MTAFNVVRFRVKPGNEQQFEEAHRMAMPALKGFIGGNLIKTGDQSYCMVGEWRSFQSIVDARPQMIGLLDTMRGLLEDLGPRSRRHRSRIGPGRGENGAAQAGEEASAKKRSAKRRAQRRRSERPRRRSDEEEGQEALRLTQAATMALRHHGQALRGVDPEDLRHALVPLIFQPYADDLARRLATHPPQRVLEIAAGHGRGDARARVGASRRA